MHFRASKPKPHEQSRALLVGTLLTDQGTTRVIHTQGCTTFKSWAETCLCVLF